MISLLLVEDELNFGEVLSNYLRLSEIKVDWCKNGKEAYSKIKSYQYDLCIIDVMMPEMDGFTLCKEVVKFKPQLPFIFLTARNQKEDILKGYKLGAIDYLTKPFDSEILLKKIQAILKRSSSIEQQNQEVFKIGKFLYNPKNRTLSQGSITKNLSPKEGALLIELFKYKGEVLPRKVALEKVWNREDYFTTRSMDVYIAKLRKYFSTDPTIKINNIHGYGFELIFE